MTQTDIGLTDYSRTMSDTVGTGSRSRSSPAEGEGAGYDVQFFASLNIQEAREVKNQTDTLTAMPIRVVFEEPYYKVLAGPYVTVAEAQEFLAIITRAGYSTAWIVARKGKSKN